MTDKTNANTMTVVTGAKTKGLVPTSTDEFIRVAGMLHRGGLIPEAFKTPEAVLTVMMMGADLGFTPTQALANISIINGRLSVYGDGLTALARRGGNKMEESYNGSMSDDSLEAVCKITRADTGEVIERTFSIDDAVRAGLWQTDAVVTRHRRNGGGVYETANPSPWYKYPKRMLMWRARSWAVRDGLSDQMFGVSVAEEQEDHVRTIEMKENDAAAPSRLQEKIEAMKAGDTPAIESADSDVEDAEIIEVEVDELQDIPPAGDPTNGFDVALANLCVEVLGEEIDPKKAAENFYFNGFTYFFFRYGNEDGQDDVIALRDDGKRVTFGRAMIDKFAPIQLEDDTSERPVQETRENIPMTDEILDWLDFLNDDEAADFAKIETHWAIEKETPWFEDLSDEQRAFVTDETETRLQALKEEEG